MRQIWTTASKMDVLLVLRLILLSYGLHVAGCCHATRWQQIPSMHQVPCVCRYSDSCCCAPPHCTEQFECFCFFLPSDSSSKSWGSCPRTLLPLPCHRRSHPSSSPGCRDPPGHLRRGHRLRRCLVAAICQVRLWKRLNLQYDAYWLEMSQLFALESGPES